MQGAESESKENLPLRTHGSAFVCFTTPESASSAKQANLTLHGRTLYVNYYEIKQVREIKNEEIKDSQNFQAYQASIHGDFYGL